MLTRIVAIFTMLGLSFHAHAAELPCGGPATKNYSIRFQVSPSAAANEVAGYKLYNKVGDIEGTVDLGNVGSDGTMIRSTNVAFDPSKTYRLSMTAYGPGGESVRSNEIIVQATSAGACQRPGAVRIIEVVIEVGGERITVPAQ